MEKTNKKYSLCLTFVIILTSAIAAFAQTSQRSTIGLGPATVVSMGTATISGATYWGGANAKSTMTFGGALTLNGAASVNGNLTAGDGQADTLIIKAGSATFTTANLHISTATSSVSPLLFLDAANSRVGVMTNTPSTALDVVGQTQTGGAIINGLLRLFSRTIAQLDAITPEAAGELYYCNNCVYGGASGMVAQSTGTGTGAFVLISSPTAHIQ